MCINSVFAWLFGQPCWTFVSREFSRSFWWPLRFRLWWKLGICFEGPGIVAPFFLFNRENSYLFLMPFLVADWVLFLLVTDKSDKHPPRHPSVQICRGLPEVDPQHECTSCHSCRHSGSYRNSPVAAFELLGSMFPTHSWSTGEASEKSHMRFNKGISVEFLALLRKLGWWDSQIGSVFLSTNVGIKRRGVLHSLVVFSGCWRKVHDDAGKGEDQEVEEAEDNYPPSDRPDELGPPTLQLWEYWSTLANASTCAVVAGSHESSFCMIVHVLYNIICMCMYF